MRALVEVRGLAKSYRHGARDIDVLRGVDFEAASGSFTAVTGRSGSGKSTLLQVLGALDTASAGSYRLGGREVAALPDDERSRLRAERIGFVFQAFHLLPQLTIAENVALPLMYRPGGDHAAERAAEALARVGLGHRLNHRPAELSGGEQQRAAIARAIVGSPDLVLADEPTGNLDADTGEEILGVLESLAAAGAALVLVTHDADVARRADRRLALRDGCLHG